MIKIQDVTFKYSNQLNLTLDNLNLTIKKGEFILLCGESGCGKTSLTRLINSLIPAFYEGELTGLVTINNKEVQETPMYELASIVGSVFQNPRSQFFNLDTDGELAFGLENLSYKSQEITKRVEQTYEDLNINELKSRNIFDLSGGEKQKIAFACVYALSCDIYVLDEPSSNLDMQAIEELRKILVKLKQLGKTIIIAEHRLYYLKELFDRAIYLKSNEISNIYSNQEFQAISKEKYQAMGLRPVNLSLIDLPDHQYSTTNDLIIDNLSLSYKKKQVLQNVSITASKHDVIAIIGSNGAGKSTFSRAMCGLHKLEAGTITYRNQKLNTKKLLANSYMVFQDVNYQLFADSVLNECAFGLKNPDHLLIEDSLKKLNLYAYKDMHPNTLSGGQKQRLAIATSLVMQRDIIVFDEPTSGLDYNNMIKVSDLINKLSKQDKIIFIVSHDYEFISKTCNKVIHFENKTLLDEYPIITENHSKLKSFFLKKKELK